MGRAHHRYARVVEGASPPPAALGEARVLRLRPHGGGPYRDLPLRSGDVYVLPWRTHLAYTHEVPGWRHQSGRRVSITFRAFEPR